MKDLYSTHVHVVGGRDGTAHSDDRKLDVSMNLPTMLGGSGVGTNPEQLFGAGFAGCFASSIKHAARQRGLDAGEVSVDATVHLGIEDDGRFGLRVALVAQSTGLAAGDVDAVIAEAKRICAYSNATRGNVPVTVSVR